MRKSIPIYFVISVIAVFQDIRTNKISNRLIIVGIISCFIYRILVSGVTSLGFSFLGFFFVLFIMFPFFLNRTFGAGDIKLIAIAGFLISFYQYQKILIFIGIAIFSGAIISLLIMCIRHKSISKIHFSIPILISTIAYLGGLY